MAGRCKSRGAGLAALALALALGGQQVSADDVAPVLCPFKLQPHEVGDAYTSASKRIAEWRLALKSDAQSASTRQAMADQAINLLLRANALEAAGQEAEARRMRSFVRKQLPDTDWRIQFQARQGDLGSIEARIGWLRSDARPDAKAVCELAARGATLGGSEAQYRMSLCVADRDTALAFMRAAAGRGHAAAMEAIGRLCLSRQITEGCSSERLCRAAQAGRIGAASSMGWQMTGQHDQQGTDGAAWLQRAADAGDLVAQNNLGEWHERRDASVPGQALALQWYRRAADAGLPAAMVNAARLLALGDRLQCREAQSYLRAAAAKGLAQAKEWSQALSCQ